MTTEIVLSTDHLVPYDINVHVSCRNINRAYCVYVHNLVDCTNIMYLKKVAIWVVKHPGWMCCVVSDSSKAKYR